MSAVNGQGSVVRFDGRDCQVSFTVDRLSWLEDYYDSFDEMTERLLKRPMGTTRLVLLVAIGELREADLVADRSTSEPGPVLANRIRELSAKIEGAPGDIIRAVATSLHEAMGVDPGDVDPTRPPAAPTPGSSS